MINLTVVAQEYVGGSSLNELATRYPVSRSFLWKHLNKMGVLRSRTQGVHNALDHGKMRDRKPTGPMSAQNRKALSDAKNAKYADLGPRVYFKNGYLVHSRGPEKGRGEHITIMEASIGRKLHGDEVVHHIDGDRSNNKAANLALMTRGAHSRLHRREEKIARQTNPAGAS